MTWQRYVFAVVICAYATVASAKELWERRWIEVRCPHFVIVSALPEKATVDLARDLEHFRAAVLIMTNLEPFDEGIPTKVYVLPQPVEKLGFKGDLAGYFIAEMRANYAAVTPRPGTALDDVLKHEYVHFLVHNRDANIYPTWLDEGFAELFSTLVASGNVIEYGQPTPARVSWLAYRPWMSFEQLLDTRDVTTFSDDKIQMFYAQSWLLVHYLMNGRPDHKFSNETTAFLRLVESGVTSSDAFEQAFGLPVSKLHDTLFAYISVGRITGSRITPHRAAKLQVVRATFREALPEVTIEADPVTADAIAGQLGGLLAERGEVEEAKRYWDAAVAMNPNNTEALVGIGDYHKFSNRFDEAQPYYEKAIALEPQNAYHELDYGEYFLDHAYERKDPVDIARDLTEARRHFARSYKLDANDPETLWANGQSYLFAGQDVAKGVESLSAAHAMLPSQQGIRFSLARAYGMAGERARAKALLLSLIAWGQPGTAAPASQLLEQVSDLEPVTSVRARDEQPVAE